MLKWLKQKPASGHHQIRGEGSVGEVAKNKIITDDPLATIQVHHSQKNKSKNKSEEIYAVSRVNPLFEEEDVPKIIAPGGSGNISGSSGYDSGSATGPPSDDDELKYNNRGREGDTSSTTSSTSSSSFSVLTREPPKHGQLFQDEDDPLVHHQAAILASNGKPVLHIVEQNKDFVQSIAVSVKGGIRELRAISSLSKANVLVHPTHAATQVGDDLSGVAKLVEKNEGYVRSIIIGGGSSRTAEVSRLVSTSTGPIPIPNPPPLPPPPPLPLPNQHPLGKKPSVTFSERLELVGGNRPNIGKVLLIDKEGNGSNSRKPSAEQDSIVTESLLLLTSRNKAGGSGCNNDNGSTSTGNHHYSKSEGERKISAASSCCSCSSASNARKTEDLAAFSCSIRKNHPVKHILSKGGKSLEVNQAADHYSSSEYLDQHHHHHNGNHDHHHCQHNYGSSAASSSSCCNHEDHASSTSNDEQGGLGSSTQEKEERRRKRGREREPKSPFGGIADHYAAAKEIAKEIESYSNGAEEGGGGKGGGAGGSNSSKKKGIVRDLLSGRGREALAFHTAIRNAQKAAAATSSPKQYPLPNDAIEKWESVRVQQVYLQGRSWKEIDQASSSSDSGDNKGSTNLHRFEYQLSGQHQGQVHSKKKGTTNISGNAATATTANSIPSPSSSSSNKQLKNSSFARDVIPVDDAPPNNGDYDASSDSGNSTDRNSKGSSSSSRNESANESTKGNRSRNESLPEQRRGTLSSRSKIPVKPPDPAPGPSTENNEGSGISHVDKVMIVTGDSQNMVVDLSGVPQDLREAIISGTALITLPDGLKSSASGNKGGYTIISLPNSPPSPVLQKKKSASASVSPKSTGNKRSQIEDEIKEAPPTIAHLELHMSQMERGEFCEEIKNFSFGNNNKTQIWDVMMQQSVQQTLIEDEKGKKKRITTVLPFHPNQDVYKSPDFTMEGQRMEKQNRKLDLAKKRRCVCRLLGILFFLTTFIGVLVALSMIYTKGQRYFGSV